MSGDGVEGDGGGCPGEAEGYRSDQSERDASGLGQGLWKAALPHNW